MTKRKQRGYMSDGELFLAFLLVFVVFMALVAWACAEASDASCSKRWANYKPSYSILTDCMIEVNGKRIPADSVRGNEL